LIPLFHNRNYIITLRSNFRDCTHPDETEHHVLFECPGLISEGEKLFPDQPTTTNTLYGSTQQLHNTCKFINLAFSAEERSAALVTTTTNTLIIGGKIGQQYLVKYVTYCPSYYLN